MSHHSEDYHWRHQVFMYEEQYSQDLPHSTESIRVHSLDFNGMGEHLLDELAHNTGSYPDDLDITQESSGNETATQPYTYPDHHDPPVEQDRTPSVTTSAQPSTPSAQGHNGVNLLLRPSISEGQSSRIFRRVRGRRAGHRSDRDSTTTTHQTTLGSTFSQPRRSSRHRYPPSRTTVDVNTLNDDSGMDEREELAVTGYETPSYTPSHRSIGTREDVERDGQDRGEEENKCRGRGPESPLPYSGVWLYDERRARGAVEEYERRHG
ncbi:hypothetical protein GQ43DRAFT_427525 [Delitschia confertaspora ATCC 74209]|uniref:Uncharacterized protein n=1 Tax=Delitschia confertaspora ATCC 74209 TaxID=1513339 RepID=A0A9P4JUH4_9PLEO|nr:hypothetical protein GQ43DRAFT_427525 [Delitschia confertaspora ATCC 74209]